MIVVGLDVSLVCTGIAIHWTDREEWQPLMRTERVKTVPSGDSLQELSERIALVVAGTLAVIPKSPLELLVVEQPVPSTRLSALQLERAAAYYMLVDKLAPRCKHVVAIHPRTRAKLACGNGNARKRVVRDAVRADFPGLLIPDDNVADAVALAAAGAAWLGAPLLEYTVPQLEAFGRVPWPRREWEQ